MRHSSRPFGNSTVQNLFLPCSIRAVYYQDKILTIKLLNERLECYITQCCAEGAQHHQIMPLTNTTTMRNGRKPFGREKDTILCDSILPTTDKDVWLEWGW
ncbi:hypothetical protein RHMOL_Rhmol03G0127900 [Rhododendron molle]|uniref:Uncharacterized protein n=1 Tax=Rhododendron molle TaxID=49168 RepID=A0ACC0PDB2_RHOML|nr:hypothetical protein RHMOL_Rhmol03G0127900 [Rhododendron molle]